VIKLSLPYSTLTQKEHAMSDESNEEVKQALDVSPVEDSAPTRTPPPGDSSVALSAPDLPDKPKGIFDKIAGLLKSDSGIAELEAEKVRIHQEADQRAAEIDRKIMKEQSGIANRARRTDPAFKAEQKRVELAYKAETLEARRMAKWIEIVDEAIRRKAPDPELVEWCRSQIGNHGMSGFFSSPPR
jgi:hypothetical protein